MPIHYTKNTLETSLFCKRCMKETRWRVADGRRQWCISCYERDHQHAEKKGDDAEQIEMFK